MESFALRLPKGDTLFPYQLINEVSMISSCSSDIPVPKVYAFSSDVPSPFVAEEYIDGDTLNSLWNGYTVDRSHTG
jgi:hypothetical protein